MIRWPALGLTAVAALLFVAPVRAQQVDIKPTAKLKHDKYLITAEEIAERPELKDGYDVIRLLRNQWLRPSRTSGSALGSFASGTSSSTRPSGGCRLGSTDESCKGEAGSGGGATGGAPVPSERGSPYADASGASTSGQFLPVVYIDEIKREGVNDLRTLRPSEIFEIRFMTGNQASGRYGAGHENGAIVVKTIRFGKG